MVSAAAVWIEKKEKTYMLEVVAPALRDHCTSSVPVLLLRAWGVRSRTPRHERNLFVLQQLVLPDKKGTSEKEKKRKKRKRGDSVNLDASEKRIEERKWSKTDAFTDVRRARQGLTSHNAAQTHQAARHDQRRHTSAVGTHARDRHTSDDTVA
eukprot:3935147-Rhodomonas_salina.3